MLEEVKTLIRENELCVLATAGEQGPHTSLMAYVPSEDGERVFLLTPRQTMKYRNICARPGVSLLVDTRERGPRDKVQAVTIRGNAAEVTDPSVAATLRALFVERHPHLQPLMASPDIAFIQVAIVSLQLLRGPREAHYIHMPAPDEAE